MERLGEIPRIALDAVDWHPDYDAAGDIGAVGKCDAFGWGFTLDTRGNLECVSNPVRK
jgi:hypothetical protein